MSTRDKENFSLLENSVGQCREKQMDLYRYSCYN